MAGSVNKAILVGNLGRDPEVRRMPSGDAVANLRLATSESWNDRQTGEKRERTEWHNVVIFGKLAEVAEKYLHKGSKVYVEGQLQTRKWQDQSGNDRYSTEVVLRGFGSTFVMLDSRGGGSSHEAGPARMESDAGSARMESDPSANGDARFGEPPFDDDVPF